MPDLDDPWWREAVVYQIYVRSFADSGTTPAGVGIGDLAGITERLGHVRDLGADAVWLTPFYPSPQHDAGYDVADHRDVDPLFGVLADAEALLEEAHDLDLKVIVDLVPNHTSSEHPWFKAALAAAPGSPERARYLFREGRGSDGDQPPNNWQSVFGGPAWTRIEDGWWYLHLFDTSQPDLDWRNPEVGDDFETTLRFWLDRAWTASASTWPTGCSRRPRCATRWSTARCWPGPARRPRPRPRPRWSSGRCATSRCGTSRRCTRSTGAGTGSSAATTATGWPSPRPGPRRRSRCLGS